MVLYKSSASADWSPYQGGTVAPWYAFIYDDGDIFGNGITYCCSPDTRPTYIGGSNQVRQRFTVREADRTVNGFWLRVGRDGDTGMGPLTGTLQGGGINMSASVPEPDVSQASGFGDGVNWVYFALPQPVTLKVGTQYTLTLSAGPSGRYFVNAGYPFGEMDSSNDWDDAVAEKSSGGSWTSIRGDGGSTSADLSLAFTLANKSQLLKF
jgi:hypothetical protein